MPTPSGRFTSVILVPTLALLLPGAGLLAEDQSSAPPVAPPPGATPGDTTGTTGSIPTTTEPEQQITVNANNRAGPSTNANGANSYGVTQADIDRLPAGSNTSMTDLLAQMPGVAIDQYEMVHIRDNEGAGFQYQINNVLVPIDINTNPPFISMINPMMVKHIDLLTGILPAQYSYAIGGVVDIQTKDGFSQPGGSESTTVGMRQTVRQDVEYGASSGTWSYYANIMATSNNTAFNTPTDDANAIHNHQDEGQAFAYVSDQVTLDTKVSLVLSGAAANNQFPNVPDQDPQFDLAGHNPPPNSSDIDSQLNMRDYLAILKLDHTVNQDVSYQLAAATHHIEQHFMPDDVGDLIYQGVSSDVKRQDYDYTAQGDLTIKHDRNTFTTGFYVGSYDVESDSSSKVFPVDDDGDQSSDVPVEVNLHLQKDNIVTGTYVNELAQLSRTITGNLGLRYNTLTGFTTDHSLDPTLSLIWRPNQDFSAHGGFARYTQLPTFSGIAPSAPAQYANTTGAQPSGQTFPYAEHDSEWDAGVAYHPCEGAVISWDNFFEITHHYLDAGLFGDVPIYAPLNYEKGYIWDSELALAYRREDFTYYSNFTMGRNYEKGVASGQFNFPDPAELSYINNHYFLLDHEPLAELSAGVSYDLRPFTFSLDSIYSSGLRTGFADYESLPQVWQVNLGVLYAFTCPGIGPMTDRVTILNLFNRENLIRPAGGIGIFQASYGPRFTVYDTLTIPF